MEDRPILIQPNTTVAITVGVASSTTKLPTAGGRNVMLMNRGSADIAFNFGPSSAISVALPTATAGGAVIASGMCFTCTSPEGSTHIATISGTASQTLYVTTGDGG